MYGDPSAMLRQAAALRTQADQLRLDGSRAVAQATATRWVGTAADAHRSHVEQVDRSLQSIAQRLDGAADALQAYAQRVQQVEAEIAAMEQKVVHFFSSAVGALEKAGSGLLHAGESLVHDVTHLTPPWQDWPWSPSHLPAPGSKDWLTLGTLAGLG